MADNSPVPPPATASVGMGVVGSSGGVVAFLLYILKMRGWPPMEPEAAIGLLTVMALFGHGVVKVFNALMAWLGHRNEWTPEKRAKLTGKPVDQPTVAEVTITAEAKP